MELALVAMVAIGLFVGMPIVAVLRTSAMRRDLRQLEARIAELERDRAGSDAAPGTAPEPVKSAPVAPSSWTPGATAPDPRLPDAAPLAPAARRKPAPSAEPALAAVETATAHPHHDLEQQVGGVWLQNAGVVVSLVGIFFFILWGYSTGRFGAGVLVAAGVLLGLASAWHGQRLARTLPRLGHAFVGAGAGAVYLSVYLGHFTLHALSLPVAAVALLATSFGTVALGLRQRVQAIAMLGVVGAFLPPLMAAILSLKGFTLTPGTMLVYLAGVDVLVFLLASRAGWSALDVVALLLTTLTWGSTFPEGGWGSAVTLGLGLLFVALGLAPLPRLMKIEGSVQPVDLAVVGGAPLLLFVTVAPWLAHASGTLASLACFGAAAVQLGAAALVDVRRPERDLWRPLTGAAVLFATAGLQRAVSGVDLAVAWSIEGVLLVLLGLAPRAGWLRLCGHVVVAMGVVLGLGSLIEGDWPTPGAWPVFHLETARILVVVAVLLFGGWRLQRARARLGRMESFAPELWTATGHALFAAWGLRASNELADALESVAGRWSHADPAHGSRAQALRDQLAVSLTAFGWAAQSVAWLLQGLASSRRFLQGGAALLAGVSTLTLFVGALLPDGWTTARMAVLHPAGAAALGALALLLVFCVLLWRYRSRLGGLGPLLPEGHAFTLLMVALVGILRESDHVARACVSPGGLFTPGAAPDPLAPEAPLSMLRAAITSTAWLALAGSTLAVGWRATSPMLRWSGLALIGLTLLKFAFVDLAEADVFWRFLTAIAAGLGMLAVSFFYQRRARRSGG